MDALPYVDTLFKEYLLFRGFASTLAAFSADLAADPGGGFQAEALASALFRSLIPALDVQQLVGFLEYLQAGLYCRLDSRYERLVAAVEADVLRLFLVTAHNARRPDVIAEFFATLGGQLLKEGPDDWADWLLLPHLQHPEREPRLQLYFSAEWAGLLEVSFRNFLASVTRSLPLPAVLRFNTDRRLRLALTQQVAALQGELERTKQQLADATAALLQQQQQQQQQQDKQEQTQRQEQQQVQQQQGKQHAQQEQEQEQRQATQQQAAVAQAARIGARGQQHRRDLSLTDWQQQPLPHHQAAHAASGGGATHLRGRAAPTTALPGAPDGEELQLLHAGSSGSGSGGSALFELLPSSSPAAAAGGLAAASGSTSPAAQERLLQARHPAPGSHSRSASLGSSISFDESTLQQQQQPDAPPEAPNAAAQASTSNSSSNTAPQRTSPLAIPGASSDCDAGIGTHQRQASPRLPPCASPPPSTSTTVTWGAGGLASSAGGLRPRHGAPPSGTPDMTGEPPLAGEPPPPLVLLPRASPLQRVTLSVHQHWQAASSSGGNGVTALAVSPSGANVAAGFGGGGVAIFRPPGLGGNAARDGSVTCGCPVSAVAWDRRADKLMLIGCAGGGGLRVWHADTRRVSADVPAESGFPHVAALAWHPGEPAFVVAANSSSDEAGRGGAGTPLRGRLAVYNSRSLKRSGVLALPGEIGLASLAYSPSGGQLLVGSRAGAALLYEPAVRATPLRVWHVAAAGGASAQLPRGEAAPAAAVPVQVMWRPAGGSAGRMLTLCAGVLCEWALGAGPGGGGGSRAAPLLALDVLAAAAAALGVAADAAAAWRCAAAVSPDGADVAVLCSADGAGVVLLYTLAGDAPASPAVLHQGAELAGGGCVCWHPSARVLLVGCSSTLALQLGE